MNEKGDNYMIQAQISTIGEILRCHNHRGEQQYFLNAKMANFPYIF